MNTAREQAAIDAIRTRLTNGTARSHDPGPERHTADWMGAAPQGRTKPSAAMQAQWARERARQTSRKAKDGTRKPKTSRQKGIMGTGERTRTYRGWVTSGPDLRPINRARTI